MSKRARSNRGGAKAFAGGRMRVWLATGLMSAMTLAGCSAGDDRSDERIASVRFELANTDLSGASLRICGSRSMPDAELACSTSLETVTDAGDPSGECPCYDFDADGRVIDPMTGGPVTIQGLCTSTVSPVSDWTFSYALFDSPGCQGTQLNDGDHDFICFDTSDLRTQAHPNQSVEALDPGINTNQIACVTRTSAKMWQFESCSTESLPGGQKLFDCGCVPEADSCNCPGGLEPENLDPGCRFNSACQITCGDEDTCFCSSNANCDDDNACTVDRCDRGVCVNVPARRGATCPEGTCDGAGSCVPECPESCGPAACQPPMSLPVPPSTQLAATPEAPFAAIQYGTNGCIEVGVRPDPPYNQPKPLIVPVGFDLTAGYPAFGYDPTGFIATNGTNSCRYNFRDQNNVVIGSAYCVQWARGQRSGTGYDPEPASGSIRNAGYVQRILQNYWPAMNAPTVNSVNPTVINRLRSGAVAMAIHYFTDGVVMPPNYQDPTEYAAVAEVVNGALAAGPASPAADPTPTITGPAGGTTGELIGPFTIGSNATGDLTVAISGAEAFSDPGGTQPFASGSMLAPGGQLWIRSAIPGEAVIDVVGPLLSNIGTLMVGDPTYQVQQMMLAVPLTLTGKSEQPVTIEPGDPPRLSSQVSAYVIEVGQGLVDTTSIAGLFTSASLERTLYGPVTPVESQGCGGIDWTGVLPVSQTFDPVAVSGDGSDTVTVPLLEELGCYSFGARLVPVAGDPVELPAGDPTETFRVIAKPLPPPLLVTTHACPETLIGDASAVDRISVRNLIAGKSVTITSRLLGPVMPLMSGACDGIDWTAEDIPVAMTFPDVVVTENGSYATPPVKLSEPGCYDFTLTQTNDMLNGGQEPTVHGQGDEDQIFLVVPATPAACE